jgi:hypothetical protein
LGELKRELNSRTDLGRVQFLDPFNRAIAAALRAEPLTALTALGQRRSLMRLAAYCAIFNLNFDGHCVCHVFNLLWPLAGSVAGA